MSEKKPAIGRRERLQQMTKEEIKDAAWVQIHASGASALSLRGIASTLGLSAPALYRYFPSKQELVTALILDAFDSLRVALDATAQRLEASPWQTRLCELGLTYRRWALEQPAAFRLIFGEPINDYEAPWERTMQIAGASLTALIRTIDDARACGDLQLPVQPIASPGLLAALQAWSDAIHHVHPDILYLAFTIATRVQGLMMVELGQQLPPFFPNGDELFARELERIVLEIEKR